jgi:ATP-dependent helicase/nuclease subunit B
MALLPAERTGRWPLLRGSEPASVAGWGNFARVDCRNEQEEALVIALALRRFLAEHETGNAALVTPDRGLAQRVAGELGRWAIEIDDSAGKPLSRCPPGIFISTLASAAARQWSPVQLLCLLKHPMCAAGWSEGALRRWAGRMERALLRGPRPAAGWQGLEAALASISQRVGPETVEDIGRGLAELQRLSAPLADWQRDGSPRQRVVALTEVAEALAASDAQAGTERLYRGEDGEALTLFLGEALQAFAGLPACDSETFEAMLQELLAGIDVRPRFGRHPRLFIWGPLEARLQQADLVILGGLNEGTWPAAGGDDPWMSRPMRAEFGLPALERRVGLAAHDFQQALGAAQVILTRSARVDGAPCVPSRWLMRLEALGATLDIGGLPGDSALVDLAGVLDDAGPPEPCARPAPAPGPAWRPILLSVTRIEAWRRDPYSIYASRILRLEKLDPLDQDPDAADLGTIIHRALDLHLARLVHAGPKNELQALLETGREAFGDCLLRPDVWAFWWPRFERIAAWFLDVERERRPSIARTMTEASARARVLDGPVPFDLTAKADRLDMMKDGRLAIIDYKTGAIPDDGDVRLGYSPQLALEAMLAIRRPSPACRPPQASPRSPTGA